MFDIGWGELVVIGIVALIAIGPKELPTVLRTIGRYTGKIRRVSAEFQSQFQEALREAEFADLKKQADEVTNSISEFAHFDPAADLDNTLDQTTGNADAKTAELQARADHIAPLASVETVPVAADSDAASPPSPEIHVAFDKPQTITNDDIADDALPPPKQTGGGV